MVDVALGDLLGPDGAAPFQEARGHPAPAAMLSLRTDGAPVGHGVRSRGRRPPVGGFVVRTLPHVELAVGGRIVHGEVPVLPRVGPGVSRDPELHPLVAEILQALDSVHLAVGIGVGDRDAPGVVVVDHRHLLPRKERGRHHRLRVPVDRRVPGDGCVPETIVGVGAGE